MSTAHEAALAIIAAAAGRRPDRLSGGNCGTFAAGAAWALHERGHDVTLCFVCSEDAISLTELSEGDYDLHHVLFEMEGRLYHGHGEIEMEALRIWSGQECGEPEPSILRGLPNGYGDTPDDKLVMRMIRSNTTWSRSAPEFFSALQEVAIPPGPALQGLADVLPARDVSAMPQGYHVTSNGRQDAIARFGSFELRRVNMSQMNYSAHPVHLDLVNEYAARTTALPPIVMDLPRFAILDGTQRAQAALLRGQPELLAYCGLTRTLVDKPAPKASRRKTLAPTS